MHKSEVQIYTKNIFFYLQTDYLNLKSHVLDSCSNTYLTLCQGIDKFQWQVIYFVKDHLSHQ